MLCNAKQFWCRLHKRFERVMGTNLLKPGDLVHLFAWEEMVVGGEEGLGKYILGTVLNVGGKYTQKRYDGSEVVHVLFIHPIWNRFVTWDWYDSQCAKIE